MNAVDHLGTVAFKLTDLLEQQSSDISTMELKFSCLNQVNIFSLLFLHYRFEMDRPELNLCVLFIIATSYMSNLHKQGRSSAAAVISLHPKTP